MTKTSADNKVTGNNIDVANVFFLFFFPTKNAFLTFLYFQKNRAFTFFKFLFIRLQQRLGNNNSLPTKSDYAARSSIH